MVLRILTANLFNGQARPASLARLLDAASPDVVAAQELAPNAAEVLRERFPEGLAHPATDCSGIALVSKRPIQVVRRRLPHRDAMVGSLEAGAGRRLDIWSVHLANPVDIPPPIRTRRAQVKALADAITGTDPVVVVGDFNATPAWPAYRRLVRHAEDGVARWTAAEGERLSRTWAPHPAMPALLRIDHVLVRSVRVVRATTRRIQGADHRAVVVDIEVPSGGDDVDRFE